MRDVAEVLQGHELADVHVLDRLAQLLAHRGRRAGDDEAEIDQVLPRQAGAQHVGERTDLRLEPGLDRLLRAVAGRVGKAVGHVQAAVEEIVQVRAVFLLGQRVGLRHGHDLGEPAAVGVHVLALFVQLVPIAFHHLRGALVAEVAEIRIVVVVVGAEVPRFQRSAARNPDRRVRLLDGPRPHVDVAQLGVFAVEGERFGLGPRPHDEVVRLGVFVAQRGRGLAVAEVGVHGRADRETGDQPSAAHDVEHGEFFGHAHRRVVERDAVAHHADRGARGAPDHGRGHQVGRGHQAVAVLVVFVHADGVEAHPVREFQFVEIVVVQPMAFFRLEQRTRNIDPDARVGFLEIVRQVAVRHEMEPVEFHTSSS